MIKHILLTVLIALSLPNIARATDPDLLTVGTPTGVTASLSGLGFSLPITFNGPKTYTFESFGAAGDGTTDDTDELQAALDSPHRIACTLGKTYKISAKLTLGNGSTSQFSTTGNNKYIDWGGSENEVKAMSPGTPGFASNTGCHIKFDSSATPDTMLEIRGPIWGPTFVGSLYLDANNRATTALKFISMSGANIQSVVAVNWTENGIVGDSVAASSVASQGNGLTSAANLWGYVSSFSPSADNGKAIVLDGYKAAGGQDVTHNIFDLIKTGVSETGGIGLYLGYTDANIINMFLSQIYDDSDGGTVINPDANSADIKLVGNCTPFCAPELNKIGIFSGGMAGVKYSGTPGQLIIDHYALDGSAAVPSGGVLDYLTATIYAPSDSLNHNRTVSNQVNAPKFERLDVVKGEDGEAGRMSLIKSGVTKSVLTWYLGDPGFVSLGTAYSGAVLDLTSGNYVRALRLDSDQSIKHGPSLNTVIKADSSFKPVAMSDASATNDSIYYSTTQSKLVYKDSGGTVRVLY